MNVYFARSLRGDRTTEDKSLYDGIVTAIRKAGHRPQFDLQVRVNKQLEGDRYIYLRDIDWIDRSNIMLAEVTNVSHGVGYELAYAKHVRHMPIFCLCKKETLVSAMITGDLKVAQYRDMTDLETIITNALENVSVCIERGRHEWYLGDPLPFCRQCGISDHEYICS